MLRPLPTLLNSEFRLVRADFNQLRAQYVEVFELASKTLAYLGSILNLVRRRRITSWSDGSTQEIAKMLRRKSFQREFILRELPEAHILYGALRRHSRNAFGHYAVEYDFSTGELVNHDGSRTSYVLFLVDYLEAARITWYLLTFAEKISLDYLNSR